MHIKKSYTILSILSVFLICFACEKILPPVPKSDEVLNSPLDGLTPLQNKMFLEGSEEFHEVYVKETGLGPVFVSSSCASCHSGNNRGHPFTNLIRFGQSDTFGNQFLHYGAPQIQQNALAGHTGEIIPSGATSSTFIAPIVSGNGFLELVSDDDILAMADPNDTNGDGISGRPSWHSLPPWVIPFSNAISQNGKYIARFGRKASNYNLHQQTVAAFNNDIGVTTTFMPNNPVNYLDGINPVQTNDPELTDQSINATVFYLQGLQFPIQRNQQDAAVIHGSALFSQINCSSCHKPTLKTGFSPIQAMSNVEFHAYTDLLLHDMGSGLDDHYTEGTALTSEWRTTPLWGLGLATASQGGNYFLLHDGRARSIEAAIELHGGEASASRTKYQQLSATDKNDILIFLKSL
ncbi:MAG: di-heme oxidoredictase family protein [Saprospiraceae bacterium]